MPDPAPEPRDLVAEILAETINRLRRKEEFDERTLSLLAPMLRDGLEKNGRDLKELLTAEEQDA